MDNKLKKEIALYNAYSALLSAITLISLDDDTDTEDCTVLYQARDVLDKMLDGGSNG